MKVNGRCHCGDITFTAGLDPEKVLICHCTDCQTLSGSAYRTVAPADDGSFKLLSGEMKTYVKIAEDGTPRAYDQFRQEIPVVVKQVSIIEMRHLTISAWR